MTKQVSIILFLPSFFSYSTFKRLVLCHLFTGDPDLPSHYRHVSQPSSITTFQDAFQFPCQCPTGLYTKLTYTLPLIFNGIILFVIKLAIFLHFFHATATLADALTAISNLA